MQDLVLRFGTEKDNKNRYVTPSNANVSKLKNNFKFKKEPDKRPNMGPEDIISYIIKLIKCNLFFILNSLTNVSNTYIFLVIL